MNIINNYELIIIMHSDSLTEAKQQFISTQNEEKRKKCNITEEEKDDELSDCLKEVRL